jgi:O-acetyl-ADP-ribose deacetylase (regulator of RNase III)
MKRDIVITSGDLFESPAQTLVNATNCIGIMGGGIAKAFRERYPAMYFEYVKECERGHHTPTEPHFWFNDDCRLFPEDGHKHVLNIATKTEPKCRSTIENIRLGLFTTALRAKEWGITSLAIPALGCGLGGLDWAEVRPHIEEVGKLIPVPIELYEPQSVA